MKILFIRLSSLGDIILTFPVVSFFRQMFPESKISYLVKSEYKDAVSLNKDIDEIRVFDSRKDTLSGYRKLIAEEKYDYVFDLHNNLRSNLLCAFNGLKRSKFKKNTIRKKLLVNFKINWLRNYPTVAGRYFQSIEKFNLFPRGGWQEFLESYTLPLPENAFSDLFEKFPYFKNHNLLIGICPSANHKTKMYPSEKYIKIIQALSRNENSAIILFGSGKEFNYSEEMRQRSGVNNCYNLAGKTSIGETLAALSECNIIVTNDTGLMHLSNVANIPVIAIFGSTVKEFGFFPKGNNAYVFEDNTVKCRPCSHIGRQECPKGHFKCMQDIDENLIIQKVKEILGCDIG